MTQTESTLKRHSWTLGGLKSFPVIEGPMSYPDSQPSYLVFALWYTCGSLCPSLSFDGSISHSFFYHVRQCPYISSKFPSMGCIFMHTPLMPLFYLAPLWNTCDSNLKKEMQMCNMFMTTFKKHEPAYYRDHIKYIYHYLRAKKKNMTT